MSEEFAKLVDAFGWGWNEIRWATINGMKSAFLPFDRRLHLINEVIKPWYADNTFA
jgi:adenosine deaminase